MDISGFHVMKWVRSKTGWNFSSLLGQFVIRVSTESSRNNVYVRIEETVFGNPQLQPWNADYYVSANREACIPLICVSFVIAFEMWTVLLLTFF